MLDPSIPPGSWEPWSARPELAPKSSSDFENRYWGERRSHLYGRLAEDI